MKNKRFFLALLAGMILAPGAILWAGEEAAPGTETASAGGVVSKRELTLSLSSLPEARLAFNQNFTFPFLQGEHFLTRDNNIRTRLGAELTPVSLNGLADAYWTPAAFFQIRAGTRLGSGWNISLFGAPVYGIGINRPENAAGPLLTAERTGDPFDGLYWKLHGGGTLQFDFAALFPGDWHHVVFQSYHEINYRGYTAAGPGEAWVFENDDAENLNGFNYYGNFLLGYQMPIFLNTTGILVEMDKYLYDTPNRNLWGDEKVRWIFSGLFNFTITKRFSAALLVQFRTRRNYEDGDRKNTAHYFYQSRRLDGENPLRLEFYRVAAAMTFVLK
ncbi:MAG: hypothetical protein LBK27_04275 [Treponema sp.]|jgi:hypothetical protein|nr:hypothetical protein [Treponema sp.]